MKIIHRETLQARTLKSEGAHPPKTIRSFRRFFYRRASLLKVEFLRLLLYSSFKIFSCVYPFSFARVMVAAYGVRMPSTVRIS